MERREGAFLRLAHKKLITPLAVATADNDRAGVWRANRAIQTWNRTVAPEWRLPGDKVRSSIKARMRRFNITDKTGYGSTTKQLQRRFNERRERYMP